MACRGLPLFEWEELRDKKEADRNNDEKVVIIIHRITSERIVKFKVVCNSNSKKLLFNPFLRGEICGFYF